MLTLPTFEEEKRLWSEGYDLVIGVDEVGRGCFAGPVVASACAFAPKFPISNFQFPINDSKQLKPNERKKSAKWIRENCLAYGIGEVGVAVINKVGIGKATQLAMRVAVASIMYQVVSIKDIHDTKYMILNTKPFLLVDAFYVPYVKGIPKMRQKPIIRGDQKSISIAAASIFAKVYRDSLMQELSRQHPHYQWWRNKGYGTRDHQEAIIKNGLTRLHRTAFVETFLASQGLALQS